MPFLLVPALLLGVFVYGSLLWNLLLSLTSFRGFGDPDYSSLGPGMYTQMLGDPSFIVAARNTVVLMAGFTLLCTGFGLLFAILVDRDVRYEGTIRTIYLLPMSISFVVTSIFWAWMYNPTNGVINFVLSGVGLGFLTVDWLGDPGTKLLAITFALVWQFTGLAMIIFLAGLRKIPRDQFEAARMDGANLRVRYLRVIIPQLKTTMFSAVVVLILFSLKAFDFIFVLFGTFPGPGADILPVMMYREAFAANNWAYGSAIAVVLLIGTLISLTPYLYYQYKKDLL
ncbi:sugar ABC transporter permease [Natronomonas sp.]|uniref:carbohydrate ABC transporter permease n=1 Tax=Natronomonas sp. TaxID=2184060 RepID=UPI0028704EDA|nr:sugar ABC transporter permease [Natronomonas sp.]